MEWVEIVGIVITIALILAGGKLKKLNKEIKELFETIECALEDDNISKEEMLCIIKEANDIKEAALEITALLFRK